jgi:hypothetical protein
VLLVEDEGRERFARRVSRQFGLHKSHGAVAVTENEQKQQLSVAYVHAVAAGAGYTCQVENVDDDSVDVQIGAKGYLHNRSVICSPRIEIQLKATSSLQLKADYLSFPLGLKNYQELRVTTLIPRLLLVLVLPRNPAEWLEMSEECMISRRCAYWASLLGMSETTNTSKISVRLPRSQQFDVGQLQGLMQRVSRQERL